MTLAEEIRKYVSGHVVLAKLPWKVVNLLERAAEALEAADEEAEADEMFRRTAYLLSTPPRGNG